MTIKNYLTSIVLLVAMLLVSFSSFAHEVKSDTSWDGGTCHLVDHTPAERGGQPDHCPDSPDEDCCDCEECCSDAADPSVFSDLLVTFSVSRHGQPHPDRFSPLVYLSIFVPPENSSLI